MAFRCKPNGKTEKPGVSSGWNTVAMFRIYLPTRHQTDNLDAERKKVQDNNALGSTLAAGYFAYLQYRRVASTLNVPFKGRLETCCYWDLIPA